MDAKAALCVSGMGLWVREEEGGEKCCDGCHCLNGVLSTLAVIEGVLARGIRKRHWVIGMTSTHPPEIIAKECI